MSNAQQDVLRVNLLPVKLPGLLAGESDQGMGFPVEYTGHLRFPEYSHSVSDSENCAAASYFIFRQIASAISWVPTAVGSSRRGFMS